MTFRSSCRLAASALLICLACVAEAQVESASASPATSMSGGSTLSQQQLAAEQVKQQEKQRIAGVVPNFNVSYNEDAVPLSPRQKLHIALRTAVDPVSFAVAGVDAARSQAQNDFPGYGQGLQGYGKRWGAAYADNFDGTLLGNAIFPILFRSKIHDTSGEEREACPHAFSTLFRPPYGPRGTTASGARTTQTFRKPGCRRNLQPLLSRF